MASKTTTNFFFLIIFLCSLLSLLQSISSSVECNFQKWVSWNVENHRNKTTLKLNARMIGSPNDGWEGSLSSNIIRKQVEQNKLTVSVSQDGSGDYKSITAALNNIIRNNTRRVIIKIRPGVYREKIYIPGSLPFITFLGNAENPPVITWNDTAATLGKDGKPLKTYNSATVAIKASFFVAANIKFENTAPYPKPGTQGGQGVALRISGNKAQFYNCSFDGAQDTLYDHKGFHYFNNCFIQGSVDFIFGYGRSLYQNCHLHSIARGFGSVTAQKRNSTSLESGFSFVSSKVTGSGNMVYLGRAWGEYSNVVFSYTFMDKIIKPEGWTEWPGHPERELTVYFGEYKCSGPGANATGRVSWSKQLTDEEAKPFLGTYYIDGASWLLHPGDI